MLNELHDLAESLSAAQVSLVSWHTHFKTCPKGSATCYALIDESGRVADLERIADRERISVIRKWEVAAGLSFPAFNVLPLFKPSSNEFKKLAVDLRKAISSKSPPTTAEITQQLTSLIASSNSLWIKKEPERISNCIGTLATDLGQLLGPPPVELRAIGELIARTVKLTADDLHQQLASILVQKTVESPTSATDWFDALLFHSGKNPKRWSLIFELVDRSAFPYPANHTRVQSWMNSRFQSVDEAPSRESSAGAQKLVDAYAKPATRIEGSFPSVRLPVLGNVILRSMSSESPCQRRYGVAESASFPAGQLSRQEMKNAIEWIAHADRRQKTWCDVSSLSDVSGILCAYPSQKPEIAPEIAGLIVGLDQDTDPDGSLFEACASRVTRSLTHLTHDAPSAEIRVFVLTKPDGFRTKVLHSDRYSVEHLLRSAKDWTMCCRNLPALEIRQFGVKKGDKPFWSDPIAPYPAEVVSCLNTAWQRSGSHPEQVSGFGIGDGLGLLLESGQLLHNVAARAVRTIVTNSLSLVLALGQFQHQGLAHSMGKKYRKHALLLPSIFGLLLAKLGRMKGKYMKGPPFLVGRLLSLADQLHVQYCLSVRKGKDGKAQVPPQLAGNALVTTAMDSPERAVALIWQRIKPYHAWAQTVQGGDEVRLAKWLLGEFGRLSDAITKALDDSSLPTRCSDSDKAELLLGYLARGEKDQVSSTTPPSTERTSA